MGGSVLYWQFKFRIKRTSNEFPICICILICFLYSCLHTPREFGCVLNRRWHPHRKLLTSILRLRHFCCLKCRNQAKTGDVCCWIELSWPAPGWIATSLTVTWLSKHCSACTGPILHTYSGLPGMDTLGKFDGIPPRFIPWLVRQVLSWNRENENESLFQIHLSGVCNAYYSCPFPPKSLHREWNGKALGRQKSGILEGSKTPSNGKSASSSDTIVACS